MVCTLRYPRHYTCAYYCKQKQVRLIIKTLRIIITGGTVLAPFVLMLLPSDFFDIGPSLCLSVLLFDASCYGCGITRAIQHLIHFDISTAYELNKLSFIVLPVLFYLWYGQVKILWKYLKTTI